MCQSSSESTRYQHPEPITQQEIVLSGTDVAASVRPWESGAFTVIRKLQDAPMNSGKVFFMKSADGSADVAVKQMPNGWVTKSPQEFKALHPKSAENPWNDMSFLQLLQERECPYSVKLMGAFRDEEWTYVVTSLATEGDLFGYCQRLPTLGLAREVQLRPIVKQLFSAVHWIHERGMAHGDLSLENIVVTREGDAMQVKLIDFGMSTVQRNSGAKVSGKQAYLAPEVYKRRLYCPFRCDAYAIGIVLFAAAAEDYPWTISKPGVCRSFEYACTYGFQKFIQKRRSATNVPLAEIFSPSFAELLEGLLEPIPERRLIISVSMGVYDDSSSTTSSGEDEEEEEEEPDATVWSSSWLTADLGEEDITPTAAPVVASKVEPIVVEEEASTSKTTCH
mmetsp:Transcript_19314/g.41478  ORF Transcript_19314/g.41478 Transcript_19314/m.41478 type:complete len:393 (+) Transcript_19314:42-1220(+)